MKEVSLRDLHAICAWVLHSVKGKIHVDDRKVNDCRASEEKEEEKDEHTFLWWKTYYFCKLFY